MKDLLAGKNRKTKMKYTLPIGAKLHSLKRTYIIEKVLGQGGFGITYKVSANLQVDNVTIRTHFAVKEFFLSDTCERDDRDSICYSSSSKDKVEECRKDFLAEAQRLNKISSEHPNIVHVNEVFEANNTAYYVMEYLDYGSLRDYVHKRGVLSEQEALSMIMPIMQAVDYLHQHRMTHLDIKPNNVMLKTDPDTGKIVPVLIDFGLSKHYDKDGKPTSTVRQPGISDGYAPVEQYVGIYSFTPQADVYALAATLYYILVGKNPVVASELTENVILCNLPNGISVSVRNAILKGMKMHKEERLQSVSALLATLSCNPNIEKINVFKDKQKGKDYESTRPIGKIQRKTSVPRYCAWIGIVIVAVLSTIKIGMNIIEAQTANESESFVSISSLPSDNISDHSKVTSSDVVISASEKSSSSSDFLTIPVKNGIDIEMVKVEAGSFEMGATSEQSDPSTDEKPVHRVTLTNDYYIGKYEVTQNLWKIVMGENPSKFRGNSNLPVEQVNWGDCQEFILRLNRLTGRTFRLPTEAEWEYAARGGNKSCGYKYCGSNTVEDIGWYCENSHDRTHVVGLKQPNELGIYDMSGNVMELCYDWYGTYSASSQTNPIGAVNGERRVCRGGNLGLSASACRNSSRFDIAPDCRSWDSGLRLVLEE